MFNARGTQLESFSPEDDFELIDPNERYGSPQRGDYDDYSLKKPRNFSSSPKSSPFVGAKNLSKYKNASSPRFGNDS